MRRCSQIPKWHHPIEFHATSLFSHKRRLPPVGWHYVQVVFQMTRHAGRSPRQAYSLLLLSASSASRHSLLSAGAPAIRRQQPRDHRVLLPYFPCDIFFDRLSLFSIRPWRSYHSTLSATFWTTILVFFCNNCTSNLWTFNFDYNHSIVMKISRFHAIFQIFEFQLRILPKRCRSEQPLELWR